MGNLYQLYCRPGLNPGTPVFVRGPHDLFGRIVKPQGKKAPLDEPYELYLIRGTGFKEPMEWMEHGDDAVADTVTFSDPAGCGARMKETCSVRDAPRRITYGPRRFCSA